jgi:hypothetical protein
MTILPIILPWVILWPVCGYLVYTAFREDMRAIGSWTVGLRALALSICIFAAPLAFLAFIIGELAMNFCECFNQDAKW